MQGHIGTAGEPAQQVGVGERGEPRVGDGDRARCARPGVEEGQLAEHLTRPEHAEQVLPAVRRGAGQLDLALEHHIQPVSGIAFVEEPVAPGKLDVGQHGPQRLRALFIKCLEQGRPAQRVLRVIHGCLLAMCYAHVLYTVSPTQGVLHSVAYQVTCGRAGHHGC